MFESVILRQLDDIFTASYMDSLVKKVTDEDESTTLFVLLSRKSEDEVVNNNKIKKRFSRTLYDFNKTKNKQEVKTIKK